ncbi:hypothetical protein HPP92_025583 [Vanilla planifolia]|uniref:Uncharacterized protein n=1 Tax=Vanilla planifolia TaxID=51239 RepID=A0A835PJB8_VANPL|nr:hypothetical protein HPP92_025583 [Vanilla planifolia]
MLVATASLLFSIFFLHLISFLSLLAAVSAASTAGEGGEFSLAVNYLLACGRTSSVSVDGGRIFLPDSSSSSTVSLSFPRLSSYSISTPQHFHPTPLYRSARIFRRPSSYSFPLPSSSSSSSSYSPSPLVLRLHFLPLSNGSFSFSISVSGLPLLSYFTPSCCSTNVLEFLLPISLLPPSSSPSHLHPLPPLPLSMLSSSFPLPPPFSLSTTPHRRLLFSNSSTA